MPLDDIVPKTVVFIIGLRRDNEGVEHRTPIGTGFIVGYPAAIVDQVFPYVATAAHVVQHEETTWVRFNTMADGVVDHEVADWTLHPSPHVDVAVSRVVLTTGLRMKYLPFDMFVDRDLETALGDRVYFVGLLSTLSVMGAANVPMVRSGTLGRLYQPDVPVQRPDHTVFRTIAHLIDCRSYAGFSGAPCFVQYDRARLRYSDPTTLAGSKMTFEHDTALLGLITGHFDDWVRARTSGDVLGEVESRVNTGVGIVTPAELIREALEVEELVDVRKRRNEAMLHDDVNDSEAATADTPAASSGHADESEFDRFEDLTRKLTKVPKKELDEKRKGEG